MKARQLLGTAFAIVMVVLPLAAGCAAPAAPPTSAPAPAAPPTSAPAPAAPTAAPAPAQPTSAAAPAAQPTSAAAAAAKSLKIALNEALNWPLGLDAMHGIQLDIDQINQGGGLQIGSDKYKIDLVVDDNKQDMATAKTAAQKEIFQDQVKFIMGDLWTDSYMPLTEQNKVVLLSGSPTDAPYDPNNKYTFKSTIGNTTMMTLVYWYVSKYPGKKTFVGAYPDRDDGRAIAALSAQAAKGAGLQVFDPIFYPPTATDISAVGTKVKSLNPDIFSAYGGGPQMDALAFKAVYVAGWKGPMYSSGMIPAAVMSGIAGAEAMEGAYSFAWPMEFDPATTQLGKDFKAAYTAKNGKWDDPETVIVAPWWTLKAALQQAGSIDPDKVAATISSGLKFDAPNGANMMVSRPDYKNTRTIEIVSEMPIKQIVGGKAKLADTMTVPMAVDFLKKMYNWP